MSILRRGVERRQAFPEPVIPAWPGGPSGMSGRASAPTIEAALQVSAVWACVALLAQSVAMMPLRAYTISQGARTPMPDPPLLVQPSADATMPEWIYQVMVSLLLRGNAYGRVVRRDAQNYPAQIELANPDTVRLDTDRDTGAPVYYFGQQHVPTDDVLHIRAYRMPGERKGLSPIQYAAVPINRDKAIQQFSLGYFNDAPHPPSVLTSDQPINDEQARTIKERILARVQGREPLVLGAGTKFVPLSVSPEESQFLATQKLGVAEVARIFGVPPEMIAAEAGNSMTYSNMEQKGLNFLVYSVQWWLTLLESAVSLLMPGKKHVVFDTSVLLRTDMETQMKATAIGIASKQMTPDEARAMRHEPPLTEEQKTLLDLVPLDVGPTGAPKPVPLPTEPAAPTEGEPAA